MPGRYATSGGRSDVQDHILVCISQPIDVYVPGGCPQQKFGSRFNFLREAASKEWSTVADYTFDYTQTERYVCDSISQ